MIYEFDVVTKQNVVINARQNIAKNIFQLKMMNVFDEHERFYFNFVKKSIELKIKFNIKNQLQINFDTKKLFENEN